MSEQNKGTAPRIAIKFGASSSSTSKKPSRPNPPSSLGKRQRSNALGVGSDSEPDDEDRGRHEKITGFGQDGAETERKNKDVKTEKKEYVIARQGNRDWKSAVKSGRKGKNLLPEEARAQQNGTVVETEPADQDKGLKWGLTVKEKKEESAQEEDARPSNDSLSQEGPNQSPPPERTVHDEAMDALLGNKPEDNKVIHPTEEDAFKRDIQEAGEMSTLEDYEAMPVEEFGAALLRGMGWDGKDRGAKVKEVKRRPNRLGLGAKELKEEEDLGAWNQGNKNRRPRLNDYRREENKRKESRRQEDSYKQEREREKERERHGHRDRSDRDRDRDRDRDYHRSRDSDRHRDRRRDYDRDRRR